MSSAALPTTAARRSTGSTRQAPKARWAASIARSIPSWFSEGNSRTTSFEYGLTLAKVLLRPVVPCAIETPQSDRGESAYGSPIARTRRRSTDLKPVWQPAQTFTGEFDPVTGAEIHGRCPHPIISGPGAFAGTTGVITFKRPGELLKPSRALHPPDDRGPTL